MINLRGWIVLLCLCLAATAALAHDHDNPDQDEWYRNLKMPDNPLVPCCDRADAYFADVIHTRNGKTFVTITDDRPDAPLGRHHVPLGTEIEVPNAKLKWDAGNPTGHAVVFLNVNEGFRYLAPRAIPPSARLTARRSFGSGGPFFVWGMPCFKRLSVSCLAY
jgi:hypothetical protein